MLLKFHLRVSLLTPNPNTDLPFKLILWISPLTEPEGHKLFQKANKLTEDWEDFTPQTDRGTSPFHIPKVC